jgi:hypothetical protein
VLGIAIVVGIAARELLPARGEPAAAPNFQRMTFRRGAVYAARFGPDGQIVYTASWDGEPRFVHVARTDPRDFRALDVQGLVVGVSRSGEVAFRGGRPREGALAGGPPRRS